MPKTQVSETRMRQHDRHAGQYSAYHDELHAEINQAKRLVKHLRKRPHDDCAIAALRALPKEALQHVPGAIELAKGPALLG